MAELIGILGGTFDPIHYGHLRPALEVMQALGLKQVRFLPNKIPPHRPQPWLDADTRRELVAMAIAGIPGFVLDDRELRREGPSYMVDTLADLHQQFPDNTLCLLMGMDAFSGFTRWHRWRAILDLCHLVIIARPGAKMPDFAEDQALIEACITHDLEDLSRSQYGQILLQSVVLQDISATEIRTRLAAGQSIHDWLPEQVREKLEHYAI